MSISKYAKGHQDWNCLLITYDEEGIEEGISVMPVWKWLLACYGTEIQQKLLT